MNSGIYSASAGLLARTQQLDLAANNLANANTSGFRAERVSFRTQMMTASTTAAARAVNSYGVLGETRTDFDQGSIAQTGNPLDVALEGKGFFSVQSPNGVEYTRNGSFHMSPTGALLTDQGYAVLGAQGPITLPSGNVEIGAGGAISVNGDVAGQINLVTFDESVPLTSLGNANYSAPQAAAQPAKDVSVRQGALESSNVSPIAGATGLIEIQRNAEMMQRALSLFNNEFNKTAAEELARV